MHIIVCDDDQGSGHALCATISQWIASTQRTSIPSPQWFGSSEDLLEAWQKGLPIDLLFLDIQIPGEMSGLELAKYIRKVDANICIVFTTNFAEYACEGYSVNALRYLRKPVSSDDAAECLQIAYRQWSLAQGESMFLDMQRCKVILPYRHILCIESRGHYLFVHQAEGEPLKVRGTIGSVAQQLPEDMFIQCHRAFIISLRYVRSVTSVEVTLANGLTIPLGRKYITSVFRAIRVYCQGGISVGLDML